MRCILDGQVIVRNRPAHPAAVAMRSSPSMRVSSSARLIAALVGPLAVSSASVNSCSISRFIAMVAANVAAFRSFCHRRSSAETLDA